MKGNLEFWMPKGPAHLLGNFPAGHSVLRLHILYALRIVECRICSKKNAGDKILRSKFLPMRSGSHPLARPGRSRRVLSILVPRIT